MTDRSYANEHNRGSGDIVDEVTAVVAQVLDLGTANTAIVTKGLLKGLADKQIGVYRQQGSKVREATAIQNAKDLLTRAHNVNGDQSSALALQGILIVLIEMQERQWDAPCDCFAGEPFTGDMREGDQVL